jgi:hypothetical protein
LLVQRARAAQPYLDFAADAGLSGLALDLKNIHVCIARAYRALVPPESVTIAKKIENKSDAGE